MSASEVLSDMPPHWQVIISRREDITDWVIHWTRYRLTREEGYLTTFDVLKLILQCGYLKPTFAPRRSRTVYVQNNTIQGNNPAVCFTDQPLGAFIQSCKTLPSRYKPYGLAFEKRHLFSYGARPVVYGDTSLLGRLSDEDKYLWVHYNPIPNRLLKNFPLDWTHEREWRTRATPYVYPDWGRTPDEGVPLILPPVYIDGQLVISTPVVLVKTLPEIKELRDFLIGASTYDEPNGFITRLFERFTELRIVPLDFVLDRLKAGEKRWARLETLPWNELALYLRAAGIE